MDDSFQAMSRIAADDAQADTRRRIEREHRLQTRSRRIRWTCRLIILIAGGGGIALFYIAVMYQLEALGLWGALLMFLALVASVVLFFMGGIAPSRVRRRLSKRELDMLDD